MICISLCLLPVESPSSLRTALCVRKGRNKQKTGISHCTCCVISTCQLQQQLCLSTQQISLSLNATSPFQPGFWTSHTWHLQASAQLETSLSSAAWDTADRDSHFPTSTSLFASHVLPGAAPAPSETLQLGWLTESPSEAEFRDELPYLFQRSSSSPPQPQKALGKPLIF